MRRRHRLSQPLFLAVSGGFLVGVLVQATWPGAALGPLTLPSDAQAALENDKAPGSAGRPETVRLDPTLASALIPDAGASPHNPLDSRILSLQEQVRAGDQRIALLQHLGWAFVEKAGESGDDRYYELALRCASGMRSGQASSASADRIEAHALRALGRFAEAEAVAASLVERRGSPLDHGLHGDTLLDQGRIAEASRAYHQMAQQRPDSQAFSRVAEIRLITGDLEGARETMTTAARAVSPREREAFARIWARLAMLELQSGRSALALSSAEAAVAAAPGSSPVELVYGQVLLASGRFSDAIAPLLRAAAGSPTAITLQALADAYRGAGRNKEAARTLAELETGAIYNDPRGLSIWMAENGRNPQRALRLAEAELARRRDIYTFDALAVASAAAGRPDQAREHMRKALAEGTADPRLWYHAGLVALAGERTDEARRWFLKARAAEQMLLPSQRADLASRLESTSASRS